MPTVFPPTGAQGFTATAVLCAVAVIFDKVHTHHLLPIDGTLLPSKVPRQSPVISQHSLQGVLWDVKVPGGGGEP